MKTSKNEELQSRREFFKSAAKAVLPVIGAVVLSQMPLKASAMTSCAGCIAQCMDGCTTSCKGFCKTTCQTWCATHCSGTHLAN